MEEDDDDFYGTGETNTAQEKNGAHAEQPVKDERGEEPEGTDEDDEEDDDEDEVQFTLEKPEGAANTEPAIRPPFKPTQSHEQTSAATNIKTPIPLKQEGNTPVHHAASTTPQQKQSNPHQSTRGTLTYHGKEGSQFPEIRTSNIDINALPTWPANSKLITDLDIDADLADQSKPWRLPGTDQTDFFNYGFDEYTWVQYCMRQQTMTGQIQEQKASDAQIKAMLGGGPGGPGGMSSVGGGGGGGMPPPMPGMPGPEDMQRMMQQMAASGMDPSSVGFEQMMQMFGGPGGFGPGQSSGSPAQGPGQGFQPPSGPSGQGGGFGGQQPGMDGYSEQQMAIMQGGRGRGGGRRGRGSGYW